MFTIWANLGIIIVFVIITLLGALVLYMLLTILEEMIVGRYRRKKRQDDSESDGFYVF
jgi:phosphate/sulfate permease